MPRSEWSAGPGFTLIELLVALAVAAILLAIAVPSFSALFEGNRGRAATLGLSSAVALARDTAMNGFERTTLCPADSAGTGCAVGTDWSGGWIVGIGDGTIDDVVQVWSSPGDNMTVSASISGVVFAPTGEATATGAFDVVSGDYVRCVSFTLVGQAYTEEGGCP
ncbi:GspH/FimT family protein [Marinobacter mangrovi]|uniref:GspH/FimT family protein n=1 Tax=Marinobacter mangrovi TaxID=2803918 RepID=UPI0019341281|nr:GspH/FimT family pseudopilin [Marinobacter mangrovi]